MSKQVTPRDFGETRGDPVRSLLVLRAWAVWRARQDDWAGSKRCRKNHIGEQEAMLERDVRALGATCRLLGDPATNAALREVAPQTVTRLRA